MMHCTQRKQSMEIHIGEFAPMDFYVNAVAMSRCNIVKDFGTAFDAELKFSWHIDGASVARRSI